MCVVDNYNVSLWDEIMTNKPLTILKFVVIMYDLAKQILKKNKHRTDDRTNRPITQTGANTSKM